MNNNAKYGFLYGLSTVRGVLWQNLVKYTAAILFFPTWTWDSKLPHSLPRPVPPPLTYDILNFHSVT